MLGHDESRGHTIDAVADNRVQAHDLFFAEPFHGLPGQGFFGSPKAWSRLFRVCGADLDMGSESAATEPICVCMTPS